MTDHYHPKAVEILTRLGIDPARLDEHSPPFDLVAFRLEQAERNLSRFPDMFQEAKPEHPLVIDWVRHYLEAPSKASSLLLVGRTGRGKTWDAYGAIRGCAQGLAAMGRALYFKTITHPDFNAAMRPGAAVASDETLKDLCNIDFLLFDDISAGMNTGWSGENLYRLIDTRWANRKTTIHSTNLNPTELAAAVGDRIVSRLSTAQQVVYTGPDRRMERV